ncbi:MAG: N-acetyltransferase [Verrucomicrobia bacterium]|nr:N-acetyltransferase [Verrucomicrobiota bacterium]MBV8275312.1 N-acetyltransferase [Verrucomicrobiota bacterium]
MKIEIRLAESDDLDAILAIYNDAIVNTTAVYDYEPRTTDAQRKWFETKQAQHLPVFVAHDDATIIGFGSFGPFRPWPAYQYTVENSLYVDSAHRRKGAGRALLDTLLLAAQTAGYHAMVAGIDATNEASLSLHRNAGFQPVAHFREVGWKFERWLDLVFMQRMLS